MKYRSWVMAAAVAVMALALLAADAAVADTFGTGANQFTISFVPISSATNPTSGCGIVNYYYRMGTYEISNDQWDKFTASLGVPVTGNQGSEGSQIAYGQSFYDWGTGATSVPTNNVSWYEAAQFVNWLNTTSGSQPAYKFTGTQGTSNYTFALWAAGDLGYNAANPYRNTAARYFLPSDDEWVKAAYWNGAELQAYANKAGESVTQGHDTGRGWNYYSNGFATDPYGPWNVGSGSQELNGTYDMMGNNWEWMERGDPDVAADSSRWLRGGNWGNDYPYMTSSARFSNDPRNERSDLGFRVASVPEPGSLVMIAMIAVSGLLYYWRKHA
jgi:formylglycine-generating enzyme required for sulfatase activity